MQPHFSDDGGRRTDQLRLDKITSSAFFIALRAILQGSRGHRLRDHWPRARRSTDGRDRIARQPKSRQANRFFLAPCLRSV
jgi:hypothetical protein